MKPYLGTLFALLVLTLTFSCNNEGTGTIDTLTPEKSDPILISATIYPLYDIARQIGGSKVQVQLILPSGESPHTFSPTAKDKKAFDNAEKIFVIGHLLDDWVVDSEADSSKIVTIDTNIPLLPSDHVGHSDHKHGEFDPHYWLDPRNAVHISHNIAKEYGNIDPENIDYYEEQAVLFSTSVTAQYAQHLLNTESIREKPFVTVHNGWSYFSDAFNLRHVGTFEPASGEHPTPRYLKNLQDTIQREGATVIFSEPQLSTNSVYAFASDNNLNIAVLDPIGGSSQTLSYQEIISFNIQAILENLDK